MFHREVLCFFLTLYIHFTVIVTCYFSYTYICQEKQPLKTDYQYFFFLFFLFIISQSLRFILDGPDLWVGSTFTCNGVLCIVALVLVFSKISESFFCPHWNTQTAFPQSPVWVAVAPLNHRANVSVTPCVCTMEAAVETLTPSALKKVSTESECHHLNE